MKPVCYILVRDLPHTLNAGKAMAQVHHAGTRIVAKQDKYSSSLYPIFAEWMEEADGFGTVLVMKPMLEDEIERFLGMAEGNSNT